MVNITRKEYWNKNKDEINKLRREKYAQNPSSQIEDSYEYYQKNKGIILKKQKKRWKTIKNSINLSRKNKYKEDKTYAENAKKRALNYYYENLESERKKRAKFAKDNKDKINEYSRNKYKEFREHVFNILGYKKCIKCGYLKDTRALQFDHKNGGGSKIRKNSGSLQQLRELVRDPEKTKKEIQVLCACCNTIKSRVNRNEFGHTNRKYTISGKTPVKKLERNRIGKPERQRNFKSRLFDILGRKCVLCGYQENELGLQFDHKIPVKITKNRMEAYQFYRFYSLNPESAQKDLQILCACCNQIKKFDNREF